MENLSFFRENFRERREAVTPSFSLEIPVVHSRRVSTEENNRNKKRVSRRDSQLDPIRVSRE